MQTETGAIFSFGFAVVIGLAWQGHDDPGGRGATAATQSAGGAHDFLRAARAQAQVGGVRDEAWRIETIG